MTPVEIRDRLVCGMAEYLRIPIVLSDQVDPQLPIPFAYYTATSPYIPGPGARGDITFRVTPDGRDVEAVRTEMPTASFSFTFCSVNRQGERGYIWGEDEAHELSDRAVGWLKHTGHTWLMLSGLVVVQVMNSASRSILVVDEQSRRWGFDVTVRYTRTDVRNDASVEKINFIRRD